MKPTPDQPPGEDPLRPHVFDGIREYDKRLPNWWLATFFGAIIFWLGYWFYYERAHLGLTDHETLAQELQRIEAVKLASAPSLDNESFWKMSRNPIFVKAGRDTFVANCASCHKENMSGGIGPNLVDKLWVHGGTPLEIHKTIDEGVLAKGMPAWGPVLGAKKVSELMAFILSHHAEGEAVEVQEKWTPVP